MTTYLTATQAATRLARSEKTIRRWIKEGRLVAHHPQGRANLLAISEDDIEQLAQELEPYTQPASDQDQDTSELKQRVAALEARIRELERLLSVGIPALATAATPTTPTTRPYQRRAIELPERLPVGSIQHFEFAKRHGVQPRTFLDHIQRGKVTTITHDKPNRPGEKSHWLSPEQQRAAIVFWQANKTTFHACIISTCPCHAIMSGHDQDTSEQEQQLEQEKP